MKIIFSPAKEMRLEQPLTTDWQLSKQSREVVEALQGLSIDQLEKRLKLNVSQLKETQGYLEGFEKPLTYPAWHLYNGLAYRWMWKQLGNLSAGQHAYASEHLRILSALYGPIPPHAAVKPYRLDFTTSLPIGGQTLRRYWQTFYPLEFQPGELIFNAASREFSSLLPSESYRWVDLDFYESKDGAIKRHSTISKKGRGQFVAFLINRQVTTIEEASHFNTDGYRLVEAKSRIVTARVAGATGGEARTAAKDTGGVSGPLQPPMSLLTFARKV